MAWNVEVPTTSYCGPLPGRTDFDANALQRLINALQQEKVIAFDTETTGLTVWSDYPLYFSVAYGNERATAHASMLPHLHRAGVFNDPNKMWIMANAKYDMHMLANYLGLGIKMAGSVVDTQVQHSLLYDDERHSLKLMCKSILGWTWGDFEAQFGKITKANPPAALIAKAEQADFSLLVEYAANDAWGTLRLYEELNRQLAQANTYSLFSDCPPFINTLYDLFHKVEVPYTKVLWKMERKGVRVDNERLSKAVPEAEEEIRAVERELAARVKIPASQLNLNSNQQLRDIFFSKLGLPPIKFTKGGTTGVRVPCVDEFVLEHYANKGVPEAVLVRKHREYSKLLGTYLLGLSEHMDHNNRIHSRLNQDVVRTGRLSSSAPNLQNIPRPENDKWGIREGFVPEKGKTFLCFDYSQLEMRLLAAASLEQSMLDMIHSGKDIHMGNAELVFGLPYADIQHAQDVKKKVGSGELPKEALTAYMKECLLARTATKSIGFGQPNNRPN